MAKQPMDQMSAVIEYSVPLITLRSEKGIRKEEGGGRREEGRKEGGGGRR
jgi:hypothetical protein